MPQPPDWKHVLETGMNFTEVRREQAQRIASDLVGQGQLARDQLGAAVDEIVDISRRRSEEFRAAVGAEVKRQLKALGIAGKAAVDGEPRKAGKAAAARSATKKAPARKAPAKTTKKATKKATKKTAKKPAKKAAKATTKATKKAPTKATKKAPTKKTPAKKTTTAAKAAKRAG